MRNHKLAFYSVIFLCCFSIGLSITIYFKIFALNSHTTSTIITLEDLQEDSKAIKNQYDVLHNEMQNIKTSVQKYEKVKEDVKAETPTNRWGITLTEEEIELLARIVMLEAGGESDWGKDAVVEVIFNRIYDEDFPNTLEGVLSQSNPVQFTTWKNRNSKAATPTEEVYESIHCVLSGQTDILPFETVYFGRTAQNNKIQIEIENHVFCNK